MLKVGVFDEMHCLGIHVIFRVSQTEQNAKSRWHTGPAEIIFQFEIYTVTLQ